MLGIIPRYVPQEGDDFFQQHFLNNVVAIATPTQVEVSDQEDEDDWPDLNPVEKVNGVLSSEKINDMSATSTDEVEINAGPCNINPYLPLTPADHMDSATISVPTVNSAVSLSSASAQKKKKRGKKKKKIGKKKKKKNKPKDTDAISLNMLPGSLMSKHVSLSKVPSNSGSSLLDPMDSSVVATSIGTPAISSANITNSMRATCDTTVSLSQPGSFKNSPSKIEIREPKNSPSKIEVREPILVQNYYESQFVSSEDCVHLYMFSVTQCILLYLFMYCNAHKHCNSCRQITSL